jgi:hypothetical protein
MRWQWARKQQGERKGPGRTAAIVRTVELGGSVVHVTTTYAIKALKDGLKMYTVAHNMLSDGSCLLVDVRRRYLRIGVSSYVVWNGFVIPEPPLLCVVPLALPSAQNMDLAKLTSILGLGYLYMDEHGCSCTLLCV